MIGTLIRADRIWLASLFQSTEEERYYLNGVYVEPSKKGVNAVSTDGMRMAVFHDDRGHTCAPCVIPLPADCRAAIKKAKNREFIWFGIVGGHDGKKGRHVARVLDTYGDKDLADAGDSIEDRLENEFDSGILWSGAIEFIDGKFPNYFAVVPKRRALRGVSSYVNPVLLNDFAVVASDLDRKQSGIMRFYSAGEADPILVECGRADFVGLLMPIRGFEAGVKIRGEFAEAPAWAVGDSESGFELTPADEAAV